MEIRSVETKQIQVIWEDNSRQTRGPLWEKHVKELKTDIRKRGGLLNPLIVEEQDDKKFPYVLVSGFSRLAAIMDMGTKDKMWQKGMVDVQVRAYETFADRFAENIAENIKRRDLSSYDKANACLRLSQEYKLGDKDIASKVGLSANLVNKYCNLLKRIDPRILKAWQEEKVGVQALQNKILPHKSHAEQWDAWLVLTGQKEAGDGDGSGGKQRTPSTRPTAKRLEKALANAKKIAESNDYPEIYTTIQALEWALEGKDTPLLCGEGLVFNPDVPNATMLD